MELKNIQDAKKLLEKHTKLSFFYRRLSQVVHQPSNIQEEAFKAFVIAKQDSNDGSLVPSDIDFSFESMVALFRTEYESLKAKLESIETEIKALN